MVSTLNFIAVLCLASGLWIGANAEYEDQCCDECKRCPSGWTEFDGHCYMYQHASKDWADAELACVAKGGNLASVQRPNHHEFVRSLIHAATNRNDQTWVGGFDTTKEGAWMWSDGSFFTSKNLWGPHQPDNAGRKEHCMEVNFHGKPNDVPCNLKRPFVCGKAL
ncbi:galactose-specific lectin nattectin-like [Plectropomus leopardus]|uniref:galactose-specific lectin nattectin-like n=1 Tax=Plectropomus leopardus TaxID=160734 RepID=UPI001C4BAC2F|nr:galactose-specific lectin nattectin-like [Plectropomus leopardus]